MDVSVTLLDDSLTVLNQSSSTNKSTEDFENQLNRHANVHDFLIDYYSKLIVSNTLSLNLQSLSLALLTQASNQLTRKTLVNNNTHSS